MSSDDSTAGPAAVLDGRRGRGLVTILCLALTWGVASPLFSTTDLPAALDAWPFTLPLCLALFSLVWRLLAKLLEAVGLEETAAREEATTVLTPLWVVGFSLLALTFPLRGLPYLLAFCGLSVSLYRLVALLRRLCFPRRAASLERCLLLLVFLFGFTALFQVDVRYDAFQYYGYLASVALDGDLNLYDQLFLNNVRRAYTPFSMDSARFVGTALLEAPFFAVGHLAVRVAQYFDGRYPANGYSLPYLFCVSLASSLAGLAGLIACYALSCDLFSRRVSLVAVAGVCFASPLAFFTFCWPGWSHPFAFCLVSCFLLLWHRTRPGRTTLVWTALGALAGLICLVRPTGCVVLLFPAAEGVAIVWRRLTRGDGLDRSTVAGVVLAVLMALVLFSPQLSLWKATTGTWLTDPYAEVGDCHDWLRPQLGGILFSPARHGLFAWSPLLLPAAFGLLVLWTRDRFLSTLSVVAVGLTTYTYASWSIWWTGSGFSNRFFIALTPIFVLGLAALLTRLQRWVPLDLLWGFVALAVISSLFLMFAYRSSDVDQTIPGPDRVVDRPVSLTDLASTVVHPRCDGAGRSFLTRWLGDSFFVERVARPLRFANPLGLLRPALLLGLVALLALAMVRALMGGNGGLWRNATLVGLVAFGVLTTVLLHVTIWRCARSTRPFGRLYHGLISAEPVVVHRLTEDVHLYADVPHPVTTIDLVSGLAFGFAIAQEAPVASVTVVDEMGREFVHVLQAGVDTAEESYLRPEGVSTVQHGIEGTDVVRSVEIAAYSAHRYERLAFRSVVALPEPMVVRRLTVRYLADAGQLVLWDVFLRDF